MAGFLHHRRLHRGHGVAWENRMTDDFQSRMVFLGVQTLTPRQIEVLRLVAAGESLAYERGSVWIGNRRTTSRTIDALLRVCAVSVDWSGMGCEYYKINGIGREILKRLKGMGK